MDANLSLGKMEIDRYQRQEQDELKKLMREWKNPVPIGQNKSETRPKPKIEVNCKQYAMKFAWQNRPKRRAARGRSSKSKSKTPLPQDKNFSEISNEQLTPPCTSFKTPTTRRPARRGKRTLARKASEVLSPLNLKICKGSPGSELNVHHVKRKRLQVDKDVSAENIPLETVFPVVQFDLNKNISPVEQRRLQGLLLSSKIKPESE